MKKHAPDTETFHFYNNNPFKRRVGDCAVRAIALATGYSWEIVTVAIALWKVKTGYVVGSGKEVDLLLKEFGNWQKHPMPKHENGRRYMGWELAQELKKEKNPVIVTMANHMTVIKKGKIWDTWNCGGKCVGNS